MQEEELKNRIGKEYFNRFDYNRIIGKIDFCVSEPVMGTYHNLLWAEAKKGVVQDLNTSFVQLILTIGRSKTYSYEIPPKFLGAFDEEKISFIEYSEIQHIFSQNDFNWNVPPSDHSTKEFLQLYGMVEKCLNEKSLNFAFGIAATRRHSIDQGFNPGQPNSDDDLRKFIDDNFIVNLTSLYKIQVDKNNFVHIFNRWLEVVKPTILVKDWDAFNKKMILSADFFLADLMSDGNKTIIEKLRVLFDNNVYKLKVNVKDSDLALIAYSDIHFKDNQKAHNAFWNIYERPPKEVYQQYILERRDDSRQTSHSKPVRKKKTVQYLLFDEPNIMFVREPVCESENKVSPLVFSDEAKDVFEAGRNLWSYYHKQEDSNPDASFYDIRKHFQGVNDKGKMNADSEDEEYMRLIGILKEKMKFLAKKIEPKVYEYGFLR